MQKLRVGVFMGGKSIEREVSFNSGRTVCDHLDTARYDIIPLFQAYDGTIYKMPWHFLHRGKITDFEHRLAQEAEKIAWDELKNHIDFMYTAVHGKYAEDGTLQGFLEILGIPYFGSDVFASALCMDKAIQKDFLKSAGIETPKSIALTPEDIAAYNVTSEQLCARLQEVGIKFPLVVKPHQEGSSLGISVVDSYEQLGAALLAACHADARKPQHVLIEEKIEGMEFSCILITNYEKNEWITLPPTEVIPEKGSHFFDYEQKYMPGRAEKFTPARTDAETIKKIHDACIKTSQALGITNISRIDGFVTADGRVIIVDPNTVSGMGPASFLFREAAEINMSHTQLINHLIETELHSYGMLEKILVHESKEAEKMNIQKLRVAVLLGGNSNEREISLETGRNISYKLSPQKYEIAPIFVSSTMELYKLNQAQLVRSSTKEIESLLDPASKIQWQDLPTIADFVFIGLHGGLGENGSVQGALEMLGIPYNGSGVLASALCMDKFKTNEFLREKGFDVPKSMLIKKTNWASDKASLMNEISARIPVPLIVKPHDDGCSVMVQKIDHISELQASIDLLFCQNKEYALVEECIIGMELTVGVIGNETAQALPPSQAVACKGILSIEEKFLPGAGENQTPAPLPAETLTLVQKTMELVYKTLNCKGYVRIDCFYQTAAQSPTGKERVIILEINTLPGMTPATVIFHQAAEIGIKPMEFIDMIIDFGLEEHKKSTAPLNTEKIASSEKIF